MLALRLFSFKWGQSNAAAAEGAMARGMNHVAANRAYIKQTEEHIAGAVAIYGILAGNLLYSS